MPSETIYVFWDGQLYSDCEAENKDSTLLWEFAMYYILNAQNLIASPIVCTRITNTTQLPSSSKYSRYTRRLRQVKFNITSFCLHSMPLCFIIHSRSYTVIKAEPINPYICSLFWRTYAQKKNKLTHTGHRSQWKRIKLNAIDGESVGVDNY